MDFETEFDRRLCSDLFKGMDLIHLELFDQVSSAGYEKYSTSMLIDLAAQFHRG